MQPSPASIVGYMIRIMFHTAPIFENDLPPAAMTDRPLAAGEVLFRQESASSGFFRLLSGAVELVRWTPSGTRLRLHAVKPGETFAEASLFAGRYHCDAVAATAATVRCYARKPVLDALETSSALAVTLAQHLATSLRDARRLLELRSVAPLKQRVLFRLQDMADAQGVLPRGVTIAGVAAEIGATPEACYRAVADLQADGALRKPGRGRIVLIPQP